MAAKVGQVIVDFITNTARFEKDMARVTKSFKSMGRELSTAGKSLTQTITLPLIAAGAAVVKLASDMDEGMDRIRAGTGKTGKEFAALGDSMRAVMKSVPQGVEQVSTAITDLNRRLGLSGQPLEQMTTQMLNLSRVGNAEIGGLVAASTRLFGDWSVATNDQSKALDYMFKVSQQTGIGVQQLMEITVQYGAPLRALGFTVEQAAAAMGKWEKEGVNMETVLAGLRFGLGEFAKSGRDPVEALKKIQNSIRGAKTESEATAIAFKAFGKRAAIDLSRAIIEGRFDIEDLIKVLKESKETINSAAADTMSFGEKLGILRNRITTAAEPLGNVLLKTIDKLMPYFEKTINFLERMAQRFAALPEGVQAAIIGFGALAAAIGPALMLFGAMSTGAGAFIALVPKIVAGILAIITAMGPWSIAIAAIGAGIILLIANWDRLTGSMNRLKAPTAEQIAGANKLSAELKAQGIVIQQNGKSFQQWADDLAFAKNQLDTTKIAVLDFTDATVISGKGMNSVVQMGPGMRAALGGMAAGVKELTDEQKKMKETVNESLYPMDALAKTITEQMALGFSQSDLIKLYYDKIITAAKSQLGFNHELSKSEQYLLSIANIVKEMSSESGGLGDYAANVVKQTGDFINVNSILAENLRQAGFRRDEAIENLIKENKTGDLLEQEAFNIDEFMRRAQEDIFTGSDVMADVFAESQKKVKGLGNEVSTIFTNMAQSIANNIVEWKGWADTILGTIKSLAKAMLASMIQGFFAKIGGWLGDLIGIGTGGGSGGGGIGGWLKSLGKAALGIGLSGGTAAASTVVGAGLPVLGGTMLDGTISGATGIAGTAGAGAGFGTSLTALGNSIVSGLSAAWTTTLALLTNPITIIAGAAVGLVFAGKALAKWASGPNSWEAMSDEIKKWHGGLNISDKAIAALSKSFGISESEAWKDRGHIMESPAFTAFLYGQAREQGKLGQYLASIGGRGGAVDYLTPFKKGLVSGDFSALNATWAASLKGSKLGSKVTGGAGKMFLPSATDINPATAAAIKSTNETKTQTINVTAPQSPITIHIHGAGNDLVSRVKNEIIPILKQHIAGGNTGLRDEIVRAVRVTQGAY
jgi:hypothetical protein